MIWLFGLEVAHSGVGQKPTHHLPCCCSDKIVCELNDRVDISSTIFTALGKHIVLFQGIGK
jgi:hypothetical protein